MKPEVIPFMRPMFHRDALSNAAIDTVGIYPFRSVDGAKTWLSEEAEFLVALDHLQTQDRSVWPSIQRAAALYAQHIRLGFIVICDEITSIALFQSNLFISPYQGEDKKLLVVSGTLREFIDFVHARARKESTYEVRFIADAFYLILAKLKLDDLFCEFEKKDLHDETFTVERR